MACYPGLLLPDDRDDEKNQALAPTDASHRLRIDGSSAVRIEIINTDSLGEKRLSSIFALKAQHWPYPIESQVKWFEQNAASVDKHLLGWKDHVLVGYLRIVSADGIQEDNTVPLAIVDTVCIDRNHHRQLLGIELMAACNRAIHSANRVGLLACAPEVLPILQTLRLDAVSLCCRADHRNAPASP